MNSYTESDLVEFGFGVRNKRILSSDSDSAHSITYWQTLKRSKKHFLHIFFGTSNLYIYPKNFFLLKVNLKIQKFFLLKKFQTNCCSTPNFLAESETPFPQVFKSFESVEHFSESSNVFNSGKTTAVPK